MPHAWRAVKKDNLTTSFQGRSAGAKQPVTASLARAKKNSIMVNITSKLISVNSNLPKTNVTVNATVINRMKTATKVTMIKHPDAMTTDVIGKTTVRLDA